MAFNGTGPELINGRLAMLGFMAALGAELFLQVRSCGGTPLPPCPPTSLPAPALPACSPACPAVPGIPPCLPTRGLPRRALTPLSDHPPPTHRFATPAEARPLPVGRLLRHRLQDPAALHRRLPGAALPRVRVV